MSGKGQLPLTLRFVEDGGVISEEFLGFVHLVNSLCGKDITCELGLDIKNCRGQGYDKAESMAGFRKGCAANILRINKKHSLLIVFPIVLIWQFLELLK